MSTPHRGLAPLAALVVALSACTHMAPPVTAERSEQTVDRVVTVRLREVDGDIFKFSVYNLSQETMTIDRDGLLLRTPSGDRSRRPGGVEAIYTVRPGGAHGLNVSFPLGGLPSGTRLAVVFDRGITVGGHAVPIEPMGFTLSSGTAKDSAHNGFMP